jgi:predicted DNA-binding protein (MmcQ/YjbR family)
MDLAEFREYCLTKPDTSEGTPFGPNVLVFKVGGKMFALAALDEVPPTVNLKCDPDLALDLRDRYEQIKPGYHMNKRHWNTIEIEGGIPAVELRRMIDHSYELVVNNLPRAAGLKQQRKRASRSR